MPEEPEQTVSAATLLLLLVIRLKFILAEMTDENSKRLIHEYLNELGLE